MIDQIIEYIKIQLTENQFFSGAVVLTFLGTAIISLKIIPVFLWKRTLRLIEYKVSIFEMTELYDSIEWWLYNHYEKSYRNVEAVTSENYDSPPLREGSGSGTQKKSKSKKVSYSHFEDSFVIWSGWTPIFVHKFREKRDNATDLRSAVLRQFRFVSWNKTKINDLIELMNKEHFESRVEEIDVDIRVNFHSRWHKVKKCRRDISTVFIKEKDFIVSDIKQFTSNKEKYDLLGVPYKRGYLFYGPPGNGKTSLCAALATEFKKDIYYLNLTSIQSDSDLQELFSDISVNSILVIEDMDCIFKKRKSLGKISFSSLLNCIDGLFFKEGLITILTTNHIEKLDPALIRSGRVDNKILIDYPTKEMVGEYLSMVFKQSVIIPFLNPGTTMSDISVMCMKYDLNICIEKLSLPSGNGLSKIKKQISTQHS